jgi:primosomal protein N' (replication factor Y) (superfamily II helicase)
MYALVAVPVPLGQAFSYSLPESLRSKVCPGARVLCEFGRRKVLGVVLTVSEKAPEGVPVEKLKPIVALLDDEPAIPEELLNFLVALSGYYVAPIGEVLRLALPAIEREQALESGAQQALVDAKIHTIGRIVQSVRLTQAGEAAAKSEDASGIPKGQGRAILEELASSGEQTIATLEQTFSNARSAVKRLVTSGLAEIVQTQKLSDPFAVAVERDQAKRLNQAQKSAVDTIVERIQLTSSGPKTPILLHGVTGSGKTEVYLHVVAACMALELSAIVLVPEIALTPQLVGRFRARFGDCVAVLHSGLAATERQNMWRRLRTGELRIAIGARSALFAPVHNLGLICVDEEHDGSFKQEEGVRYHARDMALLRAHRSQVVCVLGSATPSVQSQALVQRGQMLRCTLPDRAVSGATLPQVELVNLRHVGPGPSGDKLLTLPLHRALEQTLAQQKQAILFLNRRGFAPSLVCDACGTVVECPNCSVALTLHRDRGEQMRCHYCDYHDRVPAQCTKCQSRRLSFEGTGTERVEHSLRETFPQAKIARLDRDVGAGLKSERILTAMRNREIDILVGTQMVTKGHDLPDVGLVGVLNADAVLSMPDYQASERTFQLLVQVAGRAGRGQDPGRVIVQTRNPEHPAVRFALAHDVYGFGEQELKDRQEAGYPPYVRMLMIRVDALDEKLASAATERIARFAEKVAAGRANVSPPSAAPIAKLRNRYRFRCLVRAADRRPLFDVAKVIPQLKIDRRVRVQVDIDPVNML